MRRILTHSKWKKSTGHNKRTSRKLRGSRKTPEKTRIYHRRYLRRSTSRLIPHHQRLQKTRRRTGNRRNHTARHRKRTGKTRTRPTRRDAKTNPPHRRPGNERFKRRHDLKRNRPKRNRLWSICRHRSPPGRTCTHIPDDKQKIHQTSTRSRQRRRHRRR